MTVYIVRESNSMKLGLTTSFATLEEAEQAKQTLDSLNGFEYSIYTIATLEEYGKAGQIHFTTSNRLATDLADLRDAVTKHLDAVEGAIDTDEFIAEHEELAEAIGYEFITETAYTITVDVVVKHKPGKTGLDDCLDVQVKEFNGYGDSGIIEIDLIDIDFTEN